MTTAHPQKLQKYVAEGLATFVLTLGVVLAVRWGQPEITSILAPMTVALFVYIVGPVSGAHINPAVTLGLYSIHKIKLDDALSYVASQILGALIAMFCAGILIADGRTLPDRDISSVSIGIAEALGAFLLVLGVTNVVYRKSSPGACGVVVGGCLFLGSSIASLAGSGGVINPAVAIGLASGSFVYLAGPIAGGIAGAWMGKYLYE